jgi:hypothetical protein
MDICTAQGGIDTIIFKVIAPINRSMDHCSCLLAQLHISPV